MQAAVRERYGSIDVVEVRDVDRPEPADDEVLVRVRAASVNRAERQRRWFGRLPLGSTMSRHCWWPSPPRRALRHQPSAGPDVG